jgi:plastocyanin domain-containing protein
MRNRCLLFSVLLLGIGNNPAHAEIEQYHLVIKNHQFTPDNLVVPAGKKVKLVVENQDSSPEEFESHDLDREKIITGNSKAFIYVGPLETGRYTFFGEFNPKTAKGTLTVK